jgi:hypothetical protein
MKEFLTISLNKDASICNDIKAVCVDISEHYKTLIPDGPPLGYKQLSIIYNPSMPMTFVNGLPTNYSIGLSENGRLYNQIAYQFAHELTHIYCDPRVTNWFIESVCEMASLYFLEYLANKWKTSPPYPMWQDYASKFSDYGENRIQEVLSSFKIANASDIDYQFKNITATISEPYNRNANTIIAIKLIDIFKNNINAWKILPLLGQCTDKILSDGCFHENSILDFGKLVSFVSAGERKIAEDLNKLFEK